MVRVRYSFGSRHTGRIANIKKQRAKYPDVMKKVIDISDIVLEVLDVRFIEETRNLEIEKDVLDAGKKLVYVLNKSDLVDVEKVEKSLPKWMRPYVFVSATKGIGLGELKARIKMEAKRILALRKSAGDKEGMKDKGEESWKRINVGVIGFPNAGKSSVINFVARRGAAGVGAKAGFTKGLQKIRMSEGILILDTPGVIPVDRYTTEKKGFAEDVKVGARSYSDVRDPERAVTFLMKDYSEEIEKFYGIEAKGDVEVLIERLGRKKGFLGKGGKIDEDRTTRLVLRDWQEGRIVASG